jgi:hypothetical protein
MPEVHACAAYYCCFLDAEGLVPLKLLQLALMLSTCHQRCQRRITVGVVSNACILQL